MSLLRKALRRDQDVRDVVFGVAAEFDLSVVLGARLRSVGFLSFR